MQLFSSKNLLKNTVQIGLVLTLALALGCQSKKTTSDEAAPGTDNGQTAPQIDNNAPMSFDAAGSDTGKIKGLVTVTFEYDKATLTAETKAKIQTNVDWMKANPKAKVQIEGHCDSRGSIEYNLGLGERRAKSVKDYMVSLGVASARLSTISYGKEKPLAQGEDEASWAKNRRANFVPSGVQ